jgi:hypothetical protein
VFAVVTALAVASVVGAIVMERRTLADTVDARTEGAETMSTNVLTPALAGVDLSKPLGEGTTASVDERLDDALSGNTVRVRIYAKNGQLLYSTDEGDRVGSAKTGDDDAIRGAAVGATASLVADDRVSIRGATAQSYELLQVYVPLTDRDKVTGVAEFDLKYKPIAAASTQPWRTVQLAGGFAAILFLELALFGLARSAASKRLAARSGFTGQGGAKADAKAAARDAKAAEKEAEIRKALEDQLATLRTQVKRQEEEATEAAREFAAQLQAAAARAQEAEARLQASGGADAVRAAAERAGQLEQQLRQAEHEQEELRSRGAELEMRLAEAERRASEAELRASAAATPETGEERFAAVPTIGTFVDEPPEVSDETESGNPPEEIEAETLAEHGGPYAAEPVRGELEVAAEAVRISTPSDVRVTLEEAAAALFPSVVAGRLRGSDVADVLVGAAAEAGVAEDEARRVIAAAFVARRSA